MTAYVIDYDTLGIWKFTCIIISRIVSAYTKDNCIIIWATTVGYQSPLSIMAQALTWKL